MAPLSTKRWAARVPRLTQHKQARYWAANMVPMMQLSHSVFCRRISSCSIQRVDATLCGGNVKLGRVRYVSRDRAQACRPHGCWRCGNPCIQVPGPAMGTAPGTPHRQATVTWGKQKKTSVHRQNSGQLCSPHRPEQGQSPLQHRYLEGDGNRICAVKHPPRRQTCFQLAPSTDPRQVGGEATDPVPVSAHSQTARPRLPHLVMSLWRARLRRWYDTHQEQKMEVQQTVVGVGMGHDEQATPSASAGFIQPPKADLGLTSGGGDAGIAEVGLPQSRVPAVGLWGKSEGGISFVWTLSKHQCGSQTPLGDPDVPPASHTSAASKPWQ